jgi:hypothetical protein
MPLEDFFIGSFAIPFFIGTIPFSLSWIHQDLENTSLKFTVAKDTITIPKGSI